MSSAADVLAVRHKDGSVRSSPFFCRFDKPAVKEEKVRVLINDKMTELVMTIEPKHTIAFFPQNRKRPSSTNGLSPFSENPTPAGLTTPSSAKSPVTPTTTKTLLDVLPQQEQTKTVQEGASASAAPFPEESDDKVQDLDFEIEIDDDEEGDGEMTRNVAEGEAGAAPGGASSKKKGWRDNWLESIDSEISYSVDLLTPTSEQFKLLNLKDERSKITYKREADGTTVSTYLFIWDSDARVVVSDIDGTITKSDVKGQIYQRLGWDHTHDGTAELFTKIAANNYKMLYLTARTTSLLPGTRNYIQTIVQYATSAEAEQPSEQGKEEAPEKRSLISRITGGFFGGSSSSQQNKKEYRMPDGPIMTCYNKIWNAFVREVILRRPDTFKVPALSTIRGLFNDPLVPNSENPFYAGFGNRHTDDVSYIAVGIAKSKIFRINPKGEIRLADESITTVTGNNAIFHTYHGVIKHLSDFFPCMGVECVPAAFSSAPTAGATSPTAGSPQAIVVDPLTPPQQQHAFQVGMVGFTNSVSGAVSPGDTKVGMLGFADNISQQVAKKSKVPQGQ